MIGSLERDILLTKTPEELVREIVDLEENLDDRMSELDRLQDKYDDKCATIRELKERLELLADYAAKAGDIPDTPHTRYRLINGFTNRRIILI